MGSTALKIDFDPTFALKTGRVSYTEIEDDEQPERGTMIASDKSFSSVVSSAPLRGRSLAAPAAAPLNGVERQKSVRVDVQEVANEMAHCQILGLGGQDVAVVLPVLLFPDNSPPTFGQSYDLQMITDNGIRRPLLTARAGDPNALRGKKQAIQQLMDRLAGA